MKKLVILLLFLGISMFAQEKKWATKEQAGEFFELNVETIKNNIYKPQDRTKFKEITGEEQIETFDYYVTVRMDVVGGTFWVIQEPGTKFVVLKGKVVKLYECGNRISGFQILSKTRIEPPKEEKYIPLSMLSQLKIPGPKGDKGDQGPRGFKGDKGDNAVTEEFSLWKDVFRPILISALTAAGIYLLVDLIQDNNSNNYYYNTTTTTTTTTTTGTPPGGETTTGNPPGGQTGPAFKKGLMIGIGARFSF